MAYEVLPKAILYAATLFSVGLAAARWSLLPPAAREWPEPDQQTLFRTLHRLAITASTLVFVAMLARVVGHTIAVFGIEELTWARLEIIALESRWGEAWRIQAGAAAVLLVAAAVSRRPTTAPWALFAAAACGLALTIPLLGHAAGSGVAHTLHTLHLLGAGTWLGGLAVVVLLLGGMRRNDLLSAELVRRFSPVALAGVSLAVVSGAIASVLYVGSLTDLATLYGLMLTLKLVVFASVAWVGQTNWRRVRFGAAPRLRPMFAELGLATGVVAVTSVLTEVAHP